MNASQIAAAKTSELVAAYNAAAAQLGIDPVSRFADRKTAERRVAKVLALVAERQQRAAAPKKGVAPKKGAAESTKVAPKKDVDRSAAISASWADPDVRAARTARAKVRVGGVVYRSVREAFQALGLPDSKHIRFRMDLKATGKESFGGHTFVLVE
jgi:hypothetical protein